MPQQSWRRDVPHRCEDPVQSWGISESLAAAIIARPFEMHLRCQNAVSNHNPATPCPNSRPNRDRQSARDTTQKEIAARVANFRATQQKFEREREEYFVATLENARHPSGRPAWS